jgi:hypothetical protein
MTIRPQYDNIAKWLNEVACSEQKLIDGFFFKPAMCLKRTKAAE